MKGAMAWAGRLDNSAEVEWADEEEVGDTPAGGAGFEEGIEAPVGMILTKEV